MDDWNKTKTDMLKLLSEDPTKLDDLLNSLDTVSKLFDDDSAYHSLPLTGIGRDVLRTIILSWITTL